MYALKRTIDALASPLALALILFLAALVFRRMNRRRATVILLVLGGGIAWLGSTPIVGILLLAPLESRFSPPAADQLAGVRYVVVLGSSYSPSPGFPVTTALDDEGLRRVVEGVRLQRQIAGSKLIFSGGSPQSSDSPALGGELLALELGVDRHSIMTLPKAFDTHEEAREIGQVVGSEQFVLVTSAAHMPRAVEYMRRAGTSPIAAPTGRRSGKWRLHWTVVIPSGRGLRMTEIALHEYLGLVAQSLG